VDREFECYEDAYNFLQITGKHPNFLYDYIYRKKPYAGLFWRMKPTAIPGEEWKPIISIDGRPVASGIVVSNVGRIHTNAGGARCQPSWGNVTKAGYMSHNVFFIDGKKRNILVHKAVCEAFHGPKPTPEHTVHHKNWIRNDNRPENLCWANHREQNLQKKPRL
jgi:hypothetical protein